MTPQTTSQTIEYPKLKKVGGFKYGFKKVVIKYLIIIVVAGIIGGFSGYTVQNSFRDLVGINQTETVVMEDQAIEPIQENKSDNALTKFTETLKDFTEDLKNSEIVKKTGEASVNILLKTFQPVLDIVNKVVDFLDKSAFWIPFILIFIISAWFTNKVISAKEYFSDNTNPQVIENIRTLEAKVKELVDHANNKTIN